LYKEHIRGVGNKDFENGELFSGNRLLLDKGINGIGEMCKKNK
jgi:hypothetical protein